MKGCVMGVRVQNTTIRQVLIHVVVLLAEMYNDGKNMYTKCKLKGFKIHV